MVDVEGTAGSRMVPVHSAECLRVGAVVPIVNGLGSDLKVGQRKGEGTNPLIQKSGCMAG